MSESSEGATVDPLDAAASEAIAEQTGETIQEEQIEEIVEEVVEPVVTKEVVTDELDEDGLPLDHKARSDLGRTTHALHRRLDTFDEKFEKVLDLFERQVKPKEEVLEIDPNETVTYAEMQQYMRQEKEREAKVKTDYDNKYYNAIIQASSTVTQEEYDAITAEFEHIKYKPTNDPERDAKENFYKAERAYLRKQLAGKTRTIPVKGGGAAGALGVVQSQKVVAKEVALPKLDAAGQDYLNFIAREDGAEAATKLHRSLKD